MLPANAVPTLILRHSSHHKDNLKYGWVVFFLIDLLYPVYLWFSRSIYHKRWAQTGRSTSYIRIVTVSLPVKIIIWTLLVVLIGFWNLHTDELFVVHIKRFGRIAYVLLPLDIFLSFKPCPLPLNNYLDLLVLHKWLSRLIIVCSIFHSIAFFVRWSILGQLNKSGNMLNVFGIVSFALFDILLLISIRPVRRFFYKSFYIFHMVTVWATVFLIGFHARPGVSFYSVVCVLLLCYQIGYRIKNTKRIKKLSVQRPDGASLSLVTIARNYLPDVFGPASHVRISHVLSNPKSWVLPTHPYTIASLPQGNDIKFIIRETAFKINPFEDYSIIGPYLSLPLNFFQTAENICIICGGSGISFGLPIYNHFKKNSMDFINIKLVWVTQNKNDLYLLKELDIKGIEIYITQHLVKEEVPTSSLESEFDQFLINDSDSDIELRNSMDSFDLELNPFNDSNKIIDMSSNVKEKNLIHYGGRPDLSSCFKKNLSKTADNANKWLIACGNPSMIKDASRFAKQSGARFYFEVYAM